MKKMRKPPSIATQQYASNLLKQYRALIGFLEEDQSNDPGIISELKRLEPDIKHYMRKGIIAKNAVNFDLSRKYAEMPAEERARQAAFGSAALVTQFEGYPKEWGGRVPLKVRITVESVHSERENEDDLEVLKDEVYYALVNSYGHVAAILPNIKKLGLNTDEYEVAEWHAVPVVPDKKDADLKKLGS